MGGKVGIGRGGATSKVAPAFVFRAHDFAHRRDRTAFGFERAHVGVELACAIEDKAVGIDVGACGCEVAMLRFEYLAAWTDIAITLFVEREISAFERAVPALGMVKQGYVRFDWAHSCLSRAFFSSFKLVTTSTKTFTIHSTMTLKCFFAYKNSVTVSAGEVTTAIVAGIPVITGVKNLQIVSGGQTTAAGSSCRPSRCVCLADEGRPQRYSRCRAA